MDGATLVVIALGGGVGSCARYGLAELIPAATHDFPVATLITNLLGSLLLGALVTAVAQVWSTPRLLRPALGTGLLGGFTTFSTFAVQTRLLPIGESAGYLVSSVAGGLFCAWLGSRLILFASGSRSRAGGPSRTEPLDPDLP